VPLSSRPLGRHSDGKVAYVSPVAHYICQTKNYHLTIGSNGKIKPIVLGMAFIEYTIAALFYMVGRNDLERAN